MGKLITHNANALRFLMNEDLYEITEDIPPPKEDLKAEVEAITKELAEPVISASNVVEANSNFNYLGENNRYFLVLVYDTSHKELNSAHKELLIKIMAAKKLELRDLAILNLAQYPDAHFEHLKGFFSCNKITLFGVDPQKIGLPAMGANLPEKHHDVKVLATFGLDEMSINTDKKRQFWNVMKDF